MTDDKLGRSFSASDKFEICQMYSSAKDKQSQITILSELNLCSKGDIEIILIEGGLLNKAEATHIRSTSSADTSPSTGPRRRWRPDELQTIFDLKAQKVPVAEIGKRFNTTGTNIAGVLHRYANKYRPNLSTEKSASCVPENAVPHVRVSANCTMSNSQIISNTLNSISEIQDLLDEYIITPYSDDTAAAHSRGYIVGQIRQIVNQIQKELACNVSKLDRQ